jgi:hypothetical protein
MLDRGFVTETSSNSRGRDPKYAYPMLREDAGGFVSELDRDIEHRVAGIAQVAEAAQNLRGYQQAFRGAKLRGVKVSVHAHDRDAGLHAKVEGARVAMGLVEQILDRNGELPWKLPETIPQCFDHIVCQGVAFDALDSLTESLGGVVEVVKYDLLQSEPAQLCYGVELRRVKRDVRDQWE